MSNSFLTESASSTSSLLPVICACDMFAENAVHMTSNMFIRRLKDMAVLLLMRAKIIKFDKSIVFTLLHFSFRINVF